MITVPHGEGLQLDTDIPTHESRAVTADLDSEIRLTGSHGKSDIYSRAESRHGRATHALYSIHGI